MPLHPTSQAYPLGWSGYKCASVICVVCALGLVTLSLTPFAGGRPSWDLGGQSAACQQFTALGQNADLLVTILRPSHLLLSMIPQEKFRPWWGHLPGGLWEGFLPLKKESLKGSFFFSSLPLAVVICKCDAWSGATPSCRALRPKVPLPTS